MESPPGVFVSIFGGGSMIGVAVTTAGVLEGTEGSVTMGCGAVLHTSQDEISSAAKIANKSCFMFRIIPGRL